MASTAIAAPTPAWMFWVLRAAGVYNVLWGAWAILFPAHFWRLVGMEQPNYPFLWQCIGMIVGVYGIGYWFAAGDVARHWPIVLVGFLGKIFGPIGFVQAHFVDGAVPLRFGWTLITNDLIWWLRFGATILTNDIAWWLPFALMLRHAWRTHERERTTLLTRAGDAGGAPADGSSASLASPPTAAAFAPPSGELFAQKLASARDQRGVSLLEHSRQGRGVLVVFLRHLGCTFCREAMADVAAQREALARAGVGVVLVHMSDDARMGAYAARYGLQETARVSDPARDLYRAFELRRGTLGELFGPRVWVRGFLAGVLGRHWVGRLEGDGFQMPGAFLLRDGRITRAFRHADAADRPDYCALAEA